MLVVGNKKDLCKQTGDLDEFSSEVISVHPKCYVSIEVTSTSYLSIGFLLELIEKCVLFPAWNIIDTRTKEPTPAFTRALKYIFRLSDKDNDNSLDNQELSKFHFAVFKKPLEGKETVKLKELAGLSADSNFYFESFLALHRQLVGKLKTQMVWAILYHFGFNSDLELNLAVTVLRAPDETIELTEIAIKFLACLFQQESEDWKLSMEGLKEVFSTVESPPWCEGEDGWRIILDSIVVDVGGLNLYSWISIWVMLTAKYPEISIKYIHLLGYQYPVATAYKRVKRSTSSRKVFQISLLGDRGVGKSDLLRSFLYKNAGETVGKVVCGVIEEAEYVWDSKYLIISRKPLHPSENPDLICLMYSPPASMQCIKRLLPDLPDTPRLLILNKTDLIEAENLYSFSLELSIKDYASVSLQKNRSNGIFQQMKEMASNPFESKVMYKQLGLSNRNAYITKLLYVLGTTLLAVYIYSKYRAHSN